MIVNTVIILCIHHIHNQFYYTVVIAIILLMTIQRACVQVFSEMTLVHNNPAVYAYVSMYMYITCVYVCVHVWMCAYVGVRESVWQCTCECMDSYPPIVNYIVN